MRRTNWKTVSTLVTMIVIAGCQEGAVSAPQAAASMMAPEGAPQLSLRGQSNTADVDFTVTPSGGVFFLGRNAIVFPANAICDPATSSYGAGTWDDECTPLATPLKIHATVRTANAGTWVDFKPSLRFVPSQDSHSWVYIYMSTKNPILFAPSLGALGVDDASADATVKTYFDTRKGATLRRIKHFTGYMTSSGRACNQGDPDCYPADGQ
jgi:photosystem II stability/assembly factor-like uncharacterized protein